MMRGRGESQSRDACRQSERSDTGAMNSTNRLSEAEREYPEGDRETLGHDWRRIWTALS